MKITFLGTGTSQGIPVISCGCEICNSVDSKDKRLRTSVLVETEDKTIVIDSGPDFRYQMLRAGVKDLDGIVFTHEHKDHIAGLDDIRPYNYLLKRNIDIYADVRVEKALRREFSYIFSEVKYPGLPQINLHEITGVPFTIGETLWIPLEIMHYKLPIYGYRINDFTYITDAKTISPEVVDLIKGSKVLVVNALQRSSHISHFNLEQAIAFAKEVNAEMTYFTHISHNLGLHQQVELELPPNMRLAYDGLTFDV